ncbi:MAG: DUF3306 domain-containing protein [Pseudomonadota bacterium]
MRDAGFFWERRRAAVKAEEAAEERAVQAEAAAVEASELAAMDDAAALEKLGLPNPETLGPGDDFTGFMRAGVPERFRRVALRKLWRSNPVLANIDGLNEYDDDYRREALGQIVKTAYQVGKGMMAHVDAMARKAEAEAEISEHDGPAPAVEATCSAPQIESAEAKVSDCVETYDEIHVATKNIQTVPETAPRRMRFEFADAPS